MLITALENMQFNQMVPFEKVDLRTPEGKGDIVPSRQNLSLLERAASRRAGCTVFVTCLPAAA